MLVCLLPCLLWHPSYLVGRHFFGPAHSSRTVFILEVALKCFLQQHSFPILQHRCLDFCAKKFMCLSTHWMMALSLTVSPTHPRSPNPLPLSVKAVSTCLSSLFMYTICLSLFRHSFFLSFLSLYMSVGLSVSLSLTLLPLLCLSLSPHSITVVHVYVCLNRASLISPACYSRFSELCSSFKLIYHASSFMSTDTLPETLLS